MTRKFKNFSEYHLYYQKNEHKINNVDIVENEFTISADGEFNCKNWKTAIKRFFKCLKNENSFNDWDTFIKESIENGCWKDKATIYNPKTGKCEYIKGGYHWSVEEITEGYWYIELTVEK